VVLHQGAENWAWPITIKDKYKPLFSWLPQNMKDSFEKSSIISIPKPFKRKLNKLYMSFYLYQPKLNIVDLKKDMEQRLEQLTVESNKVRDRMQTMIKQLQIEAKSQ